MSEKNTFIDISNEEFRVYTFVKGNQFFKVKIENPLRLIKGVEGDRIFDLGGLGHLIPRGWIHLFWKNREEEEKNPKL